MQESGEVEPATTTYRMSYFLRVTDIVMHPYDRVVQTAWLNKASLLRRKMSFKVTDK
jgi:hypothetical protein